MLRPQASCPLQTSCAKTEKRVKQEGHEEGCLSVVWFGFLIVMPSFNY